MGSLHIVQARSISEIQQEIQQKQQEKEAAGTHSHILGQQAQGIQGEINLLIEKSIPWEEFITVVNEWKRQYAEGAIEPFNGPQSQGCRKT